MKEPTLQLGSITFSPAFLFLLEHSIWSQPTPPERRQVFRELDCPYPQSSLMRPTYLGIPCLSSHLGDLVYLSSSSLFDCGVFETNQLCWINSQIFTSSSIRERKSPEGRSRKFLLSSFSVEIKHDSLFPRDSFDSLFNTTWLTWVLGAGSLSPK